MSVKRVPENSSGPAPDSDVGAVPGSAAPRRPRNPYGQGERLRGELIAAADRILAETGSLEALSLRGVARAVGIATPSIYLHFPNKGALVGAVIAARFAELATAIRTAVAAAAPQGAAEILLAGCLAYCRFATDHPNAYRVLFGRRPDRAPHPPAPSPALPGPVSSVDLRAGEGERLVTPPSPLDAGNGEAKGPRVRGGEGGRGGEGNILLPASTDAFQFLLEGVQACMRAGLAPQANPERVATNVWTALHGIVTLRAAMPRLPWPPLEEQVSDVLSGMAGLRHNRGTGAAEAP